MRGVRFGRNTRPSPEQRNLKNVLMGHLMRQCFYLVAHVAELVVCRKRRRWPSGDRRSLWEAREKEKLGVHVGSDRQRL